MFIYAKRRGESRQYSFNDRFIYSPQDPVWHVTRSVRSSPGLASAQCQGPDGIRWSVELVTFSKNHPHLTFLVCLHRSTDFFNHTFIRKPQQPPASTAPQPLPVPTTTVREPSPPKTEPAVVSPATATLTPPPTEQHNNNAPTPPEEADDFVLVPSPTQLKSRRTGATIYGGSGVAGDASAQPIPVPSQRSAFLKVCCQPSRSSYLFHRDPETKTGKTELISFYFSSWLSVASSFSKE